MTSAHTPSFSNIAEKPTQRLPLMQRDPSFPPATRPHPFKGGCSFPNACFWEEPLYTRACKNLQTPTFSRKPTQTILAIKLLVLRRISSASHFDQNRFASRRLVWMDGRSGRTGNRSGKIVWPAFPSSGFLPGWC